MLARLKDQRALFGIRTRSIDLFAHDVPKQVIGQVTLGSGNDYGLNPDLIDWFWL